MGDVQTDDADTRPTMTDRQIELSGVPNLDEVLGGGLPRGSLVLIAGPPGSGKTTLAAQIAFEGARNGQRVLILTALSEPTNKLVEHLRHFPFFDVSFLGDSIQILSIEQFSANGLDRTVTALTDLVRSMRAGIVVLDGIQGIPGMEGSTAATRPFLYWLGTMLGLLGSTTIVTTEAAPRDPAMHPVATTTDVILGLHYWLAGVREQRGIEVVKVRGAAPLPGLHALILGVNGMEVYPRLEARVRAAQRSVARADQRFEESGHDLVEGEGEAHTQPRAGFGIAELDRLLGGGLIPATSTVIAGDLGTGKTSLALHFALEGVQRGEPVVWLSFRESRAQLLLKGAILGGDALRMALAPGGGLTLLETPPVELLADVVGDQLLHAVDGTKARRVVIDSLTELVRVISANGDGARIDEYLTALLVALHSRGVTNLFISEVLPSTNGQAGRIAHSAAVAENLLLLEDMPEDGRTRRVLSVRKLRFSPHDSGLHEFSLGPAPYGLRLLAQKERREGERGIGSGSAPDRS